MTEWRVLVADTLTGAIVSDVDHIDQPSFTRKIGDKGDLSVTVYVDSRPNVGVDFHEYTRDSRYSWVLAYGDDIVQAGPVRSRSFTDETRQLEVTCGGLLSEFARRTTCNPRGHTAIVHPSQDLHYSGLSLRGIMARLVLDNMDQAGYALPVVVPEPEAGTDARDYFGYGLKPVGDNLTELSEAGGPEFDFAPEFAAHGTRIRWRLDIGRPLLGDQHTTTVWDYSSAVDTIDVDENASASPLSRVWVKGAGSDRGLLTGFAEDPTWRDHARQPLDYVDGGHTSTVDQVALEAYADADLREFTTPPQTWTCELRITGSGDLSQWRLGDAPIFAVDQHGWLRPGAYRRRILGYSNGSADTVSLELADAKEGS